MSEVVNWGQLGLRDRYIDLLARQLIASWVLAVFFGIGVIGFVLWVFYRPTPAIFVCLAIFAIGVVTGGWTLSVINRHLRAIEVYLNFYERRHAVRHQVFCQKWWHCFGTH
ncbi:hypothetical protein LUCX_136 [Xanthomonas phage vB_XciM_LucasX]|nr:hypothetical protein LUCX_136 [Xanthomonas phage vB_XciM_LucasX]